MKIHIEDIPRIGNIDFELNDLLTFLAAALASLIVFILWFSIIVIQPDLNHAIKWKTFNETNIGALISTLLFISLASQSALEVFVSNFRQFKRLCLKESFERQQLFVIDLKDRIKRLKDATEIEIQNNKLIYIEKERDKAKVKLDKYRTNTRKMISVISLVIGFLIASAGVRVLQPFVDKLELSNLQTNFFHALDIILTASIIAGGSGGINRLTSVYDSFTSSAVRNTENNPSPVSNNIENNTPSEESGNPNL